MKLTLTVKQSKDVETRQITKVKAMYFDKGYLQIYKENGLKHFVRLSTLLEVVQS